MKPFDLEAAKKGAPVCTRDGRDVRIICFDLKSGNFPIVGLIRETENNEVLMLYTITGTQFCKQDTLLDLFMKPTKISCYMNIYRSKRSAAEFNVGPITTKEDCEYFAKLSSDDYIKTISFTIEE